LSQAANTFSINRAHSSARASGAVNYLRHTLDAVVLMVILAATALCVSLYMRTRTEYAAANARHKTASEKVENLQVKTERLQRQIELLQKEDPRMIETEARQGLGFVRPDDVVINLAPDQKDNPAESGTGEPSEAVSP
jgi:cell division protein FtsB